MSTILTDGIEMTPGMETAFECAAKILLGNSLMETTFSPDSRCIYMHEYYTDGVPEICHAAKDGDAGAIHKMAEEMAKDLRGDEILVPVPSRSGIATITRRLADEISKLSGCKVENVLRGPTRESLYELKKNGQAITPEMLGLQASHIPEGRVMLVDNVVATGTTARAAMKAIPGAWMLAYAMDSGAYKPITEGVEGETTGKPYDVLVDYAVKLKPYDKGLLEENCTDDLRKLVDREGRLTQPVRFTHYTRDEDSLLEILKNGIEPRVSVETSFSGVWTNVMSEEMLRYRKDIVVFDAPAGTRLWVANRTQGVFFDTIPPEWFVSIDFPISDRGENASLFAFIGAHEDRWPTEKISEFFSDPANRWIWNEISSSALTKLISLYTQKWIEFGDGHVLTESVHTDMQKQVRTIAANALKTSLAYLDQMENTITSSGRKKTGGVDIHSPTLMIRGDKVNVWLMLISNNPKTKNGAAYDPRFNIILIDLPAIIYRYWGDRNLVSRINNASGHNPAALIEMFIRVKDAFVVKGNLLVAKDGIYPRLSLLDVQCIKAIVGSDLTKEIIVHETVHAIQRANGVDFNPKPEFDKYGQECTTENILGKFHNLLPWEIEACIHTAAEEYFKSLDTNYVNKVIIDAKRNLFTKIEANKVYPKELYALSLKILNSLVKTLAQIKRRYPKISFDDAMKHLDEYAV
jgi:hypothetical protein